MWLRFLASDLLGSAKLGHQVHKVNQKKAKFRNINANYGLKHNPEVLVRLQILSVGGSGCCYRSCLWLLYVFFGGIGIGLNRNKNMEISGTEISECCCCCVSSLFV